MIRSGLINIMFDDIKREIIKYGKISADRGLSPGISGNISVRNGDFIVITSSGSANGFLSEHDFSVIDFDCNVIEGNKKPSSEKLLHAEFYKRRFDVNAICHFHSPYLTSYAACAQSINDNVLPEIIYSFKNIPLAKYAIPGSEELVFNTAVYFNDYNVIMMENHGFIAGGETLKDAFLKAETCENYAKTLVFSKILGGAKMLDENEVEKIHALKR